MNDKIVCVDCGNGVYGCKCESPAFISKTSYDIIQKAIDKQNEYTMKNPLLIKKYKAFRDYRQNSIYFIIESKNEEHAMLLLIRELENLGVDKPHACAMEDYTIVEILKDPLN